MWDLETNFSKDMDNFRIFKKTLGLLYKNLPGSTTSRDVILQVLEHFENDPFYFCACHATHADRSKDFIVYLKKQEGHFDDIRECEKLDIYLQNDRYSTEAVVFRN